MNQNTSYFYEIRAYLNTSDGRFDISDSVFEIVINQSVATVLPRVTIYLQKLVFQLHMKNIDSIEIQILSDLNNGSPRFTDRYLLLPLEVNFDIMLDDSEKRLPSKEIIPIETTILSCYKYATKQKDTIILFNTSISDIVQKLITDENVLLKSNKLSNQKIEQIVIPSNDINIMLQYVNYHFSFTKHANSLVLDYNLEKNKPEVCITDYDEALKQGLYDTTIFVQVPSESNKQVDNVIGEVVKNPDRFIVTHYPVNFKNDTSNFAYNKIEYVYRPDKDLYKVYKKTFDSESIKYRNFSDVENNVRQLFSSGKRVFQLSNFSGNDVQEDSVNSIIGNKLLFLGSCEVKIEQLETLRKVWPGYIVNLTSVNTNLLNLLGLWVIGSMTYVYTRLKLPSWESYGELILHRSNVLWK